MIPHLLTLLLALTLTAAPTHATAHLTLATTPTPTTLTLGAPPLAPPHPFSTCPASLAVLSSAPPPPPLFTTLSSAPLFAAATTPPTPPPPPTPPTPTLTTFPTTTALPPLPPASPLASHRPATLYALSPAAPLPPPFPPLLLSPGLPLDPAAPSHSSAHVLALPPLHALATAPPTPLALHPSSLPPPSARAFHSLSLVALPSGPALALFGGFSLPLAFDSTLYLLAPHPTDSSFVYSALPTSPSTALAGHAAAFAALPDPHLLLAAGLLPNGNPLTHILALDLATGAVTPLSAPGSLPALLAPYLVVPDPAFPSALLLHAGYTLPSLAPATHFVLVNTSLPLAPTTAALATDLPPPSLLTPLLTSPTTAYAVDLASSALVATTTVATPPSVATHLAPHTATSVMCTAPSSTTLYAHDIASPSTPTTLVSLRTTSLDALAATPVATPFLDVLPLFPAPALTAYRPLSAACASLPGAVYTLVTTAAVPGRLTPDARILVHDFASATLGALTIPPPALAACADASLAPTLTALPPATLVLACDATLVQLSPVSRFELALVANHTLAPPAALSVGVVLPGPFAASVVVTSSAANGATVVDLGASPPTAHTVALPASTPSTLVFALARGPTTLLVTPTATHTIRWPATITTIVDVLPACLLPADGAHVVPLGVTPTAAAVLVVDAANVTTAVAVPETLVAAHMAVSPASGSDDACVLAPATHACATMATALALLPSGPSSITVLDSITLSAPLVVPSHVLVTGAASAAVAPTVTCATGAAPCVVLDGVADAGLAFLALVAGPNMTGPALSVSQSSVTLTRVSLTAFAPVPTSAAVMAKASEVTLHACAVVGNSGGGVAVADGSTLVVSGSRIVGNAAHEGGGIMVRTGSAAVFGLPASVVANNTAVVRGGGLAVVSESWAQVAAVVFEGNTAERGGGVACGAASALSLRAGVVVVANRAVEGGGIDAVECTLDMADVVVVRNTAVDAGGGLLYDANDALPVLVRTAFEYNSAGVRGGGVFLGRSDALASLLASNVSSTVTFVGNTADQGPSASSVGFALVVVATPGVVTSGSPGTSYFVVSVVDAVGAVVVSDSSSFVSAALAVPGLDAVVTGESQRVSRGLAVFSSLALFAAPTNVSGTAVRLAFSSQAVGPTGSATSPPVEVADCLPGTYVAPVSGGGFVCAPCEVGTISDAPNAGSCAACPAGSVANAERSGCLACPPGSFSTEGDLACRLCALGSASNFSGTAEACDRCERGTFAADVGLLACETCPSGSYANIVGATDCVRCETGSFTGDPTAPCTPCDLNVAVCEGDRIFSKPGYYMYDANSFGACDDTCLGNNVCSPAHTGELCASCIEGYLAIDGSCKKCTSGNYFLAVMLYFVIPLIFLGYTVFFTKRSSGNMQVVIFFGQTMALILENLPRPSSSATSTSWGVFNMDLNLVLGSCLLPLSFFGQTVFKLLQPVIFTALLGVLYLAEVGVYKATGLRCPRYPHDYSKDVDVELESFHDKLMRFIKDHVHRAPRKDRYYKSMLAVALFTYTPTMRAILALMRCRAPHPNEPYRRVLSADLSIQCKNSVGEWDPVYFQFRILAIVLCVVYVYALPAFLLALVFYIKYRSSFENVSVENRYSTLYSPYEPQFFYWGPFMQYRKTVLVSLTAFVNDDDVQRLLFVTALLFFASVHLTLRPYEDDINDVAETLTLIILLFMATIVVSHWIARPETSSGQTELAIFFVSVVAAVGFVAFFLFLVYVRWKSYSEQKLEEEAEEVERVMIEDPDATCSSLTTEELDVALGFDPVVRIAPKYVVAPVLAPAAPATATLATDASRDSDDESDDDTSCVSSFSEWDRGLGGAGGSSAVAPSRAGPGRDDDETSAFSSDALGW